MLAEAALAPHPDRLDGPELAPVHQSLHPLAIELGFELADIPR